MKIAGIVAEYNPFHNGHLYQINQTKSQTGADAVVAVISGNFSQRGEATITDKFTRTKMALLNGVDLVLELPVSVATASAERFAEGAISIFEQSHIISLLSFGSECGDISLLKSISATLIDEKDSIDLLIKKQLKNGLSYPRARQSALIEFLDTNKRPDFAEPLFDTLKSPNNILGIEYIKALTKLNSSITPFTLKRKGANYHAPSITGNIASATAIRNALANSSNEHLHSMPIAASSLLKNTNLPSMDKLSAFLHFKLMFSKAEELYATWDIPRDLIHTFMREVQDCPSYIELTNRCTSKTYTKATVKRSLLRILLEIKSEDLTYSPDTLVVPYIRVLGCRKDSTHLLKKLTTHSSTTIITNLSKQYNTLNGMQKKWVDYELKATKLYAYATSNPNLTMSDFTQPFIIL